MTPLNGVGESAATALEAMVTVYQLTGCLRGKKSSVRVRKSLGHILLHHHPPLMSQGLDRRQILRPLRRSESQKKSLQNPNRRRLLLTPTCPSLWTTLVKTLHLLTSPRILRAANYIWIPC